MNKLAISTIVTATLLAVSLSGCHKETDLTPNSLQPLANKPISQDIVANYPFDWETAITMPVSANSPKQVEVPWRSQGGTPLDPGIVSDYKKVDGWELVYNTFVPDNFPTAGYRGTIPTFADQPTGGLYFALYNRYRGLLRYYMYIPTGMFGNSTQFSHGLQLYSSSNSSKALNFEDKDIVDLANNTYGFSETSKDGVPTTGGWYAMQYQIAYDPTLGSSTFPNPGFTWRVYSLNVTQLKMEGEEIGTMKGTASTPQAGFNWANAAVNVGLSAIEIVSTDGLNLLQGVISDGLKRALNSGTSGSTSGYLSGLFGSSTGGTQTIDLNMNSSISTTGTATGSQLYKEVSFVFPGQNSGSIGVDPLINYTIGLFSLSQKPVVTRSYSSKMGPNRGDPNTYNYNYSINRLVSV